MKPGDLIWLRDDMENLTPAIYISEATAGLCWPRVKVLQGGVIFGIAKHRTRVIDETR
jgi:hypothetical protein